MKLKIALCQIKVIDNKETNIKNAIKMIKKAKKENVDLAILPEMFNCPYENEKFIEYSEVLEDSYTLEKISTIAKEENIHILAGSFPEKVILEEGYKIYNTTCLFDNNGELIGTHRKVHLFDIDIADKISFKESDTLNAGKNISVINTKFGKIGIGICYDIRFIELSRILALEGAKILIFPGAFNLTTGPAHWELLFRSRALDNQVFTIGVAPALDKDASYNSYGHSIIANPMGEIVSQAEYDEELIIKEIDLEEVEKVREEIPILKNRRNDLYKIEKLVNE